MKRIGIVSDSHGNIAALEKMVRQAGKIDLWLHAGDCGEDKRLLEEFSGVPVEIVRGNNDYTPPFYPYEKTITIEKVKIYLCHGHQWNSAMRLPSLFYKAQESGAALAVFGHTHVQEAHKETGIWLFNPGSIARPRDAYDGSYGTAVIQGGCIQSLKVYRLNGSCKDIE